MRRSSWMSALLAGLLILAAPAWPAPVNPSTGPGKISRDKASTLVRLLGDRSFKVREQSTKDLIALGQAAKKALLAGCKDPDPEIRRRCQFILPLALKRDLEVRLAALLADKEGKQNHALPGWKRYKNEIGADQPARQLFVDMQRANAELLEASEKQPRTAGGQFATRCQALDQQLYTPTGRHNIIPLADLATLMFVASAPGFQITGQATWQFSRLLDDQLAERLKPGPMSPLVRKMLLTLVKQQADSGSIQTMLKLAVKFQLKEGLEIALKELKNPKAVPNNRGAAILVVQKLGGKKYRNLLEPLLNDTGVVGGFGINNVQGTTQVGDVALAALVQMTGQKLKNYGFPAAMLGDYDFAASGGVAFLGFSDPMQRAAARAQWNTWKAKQDKKK